MRYKHIILKKLHKLKLKPCNYDEYNRLKESYNQHTLHIILYRHFISQSVDQITV